MKFYFFARGGSGFITYCTVMTYVFLYYKGVPRRKWGGFPPIWYLLSVETSGETLKINIK